MANVLAIHSVCSSIATFLNNTYPASTNGTAMPSCDFVVLSSQEMANPPSEGNRVSLYLYRATVNEHSRQQRPARAPTAVPAPLHLDLHILSGGRGQGLGPVQLDLGRQLLLFRPQLLGDLPALALGGLFSLRKLLFLEGQVAL